MIRRTWLTGASIGRRRALRVFAARCEGAMRISSHRSGWRFQAQRFVDGCSGRSAARPGGCGPRPPVILDRGVSRPFWAGDAGMRMPARLERDYGLSHWADDDAVLVLDETGFLKQGKASCGVARQYTGRRARSPIARATSSRPTSRDTATPSSTERFICRKPGRMMPSAWRQRMFPKQPALRQSQPRPTFRDTATPSSTERFRRKPGRMMPSAWRRRMFPKQPALRQSQPSHSP